MHLMEEIDREEGCDGRSSGPLSSFISSLPLRVGIVIVTASVAEKPLAVTVEVPNTRKMKYIPCPWCQRRLRKEGSRNFVQCRKCKTGCCWRCRRPVMEYEAAAHYASSSRSGCANREYEEVRDVPGVDYIQIMVGIVSTPVAVIFALGTAPLAWLFLCFRREFAETVVSHYSGWLVIIGGLVTLVVMMPACLLRPLYRLARFILNR